MLWLLSRLMLKHGLAFTKGEDTDLLELIHRAKIFLDEQVGIRWYDGLCHVEVLFWCLLAFLGLCFCFFLLSLSGPMAIFSAGLIFSLICVVFLTACFLRSRNATLATSQGDLAGERSEEKCQYDQQARDLNALLIQLKGMDKNEQWVQITNPMLESHPNMLDRLFVSFDTLIKRFQHIKNLTSLVDVEKAWDKKYPCWAGLFSNQKRFFQKKAIAEVVKVLDPCLVALEKKQARGLKDICPLLAQYCACQLDIESATVPTLIF